MSTSSSVYLYDHLEGMDTILRRHHEKKTKKMEIKENSVFIRLYPNYDPSNIELMSLVDLNSEEYSKVFKSDQSLNILNFVVNMAGVPVFITMDGQPREIEADKSISDYNQPLILETTTQPFLVTAVNILTNCLEYQLEMLDENRLYLTFWPSEEIYAAENARHAVQAQIESCLNPVKVMFDILSGSVECSSTPTYGSHPSAFLDAVERHIGSRHPARLRRSFMSLYNQFLKASAAGRDPVYEMLHEYAVQFEIIRTPRALVCQSRKLEISSKINSVTKYDVNCLLPDTQWHRCQSLPNAGRTRKAVLTFASDEEAADALARVRESPYNWHGKQRKFDAAIVEEWIEEGSDEVEIGVEEAEPSVVDYEAAPRNAVQLSALALQKSKSARAKSRAWGGDLEMDYPGLTLSVWAVVCFSPCLTTKTLQYFAEKIKDKCNDAGMKVTESPVAFVYPEHDPDGVEGVLRQMHSAYPGLQLVLVVLWRGNQIYDEVKRSDDLLPGLVTQCIQDQNLSRCTDDVVSNISCKMNVKLGLTTDNPLTRRPTRQLVKEEEEAGPGWRATLDLMVEKYRTPLEWNPENSRHLVTLAMDWFYTLDEVIEWPPSTTEKKCEKPTSNPQEKTASTAGPEGSDKDDSEGWKWSTHGAGASLMAKMGYEAGKGLGKDEQGITAPIEASVKKGRRALGFEAEKNPPSKKRKNKAAINFETGETTEKSSGGADEIKDEMQLFYKEIADLPGKDVDMENEEGNSDLAVLVNAALSSGDAVMQMGTKGWRAPPPPASEQPWLPSLRVHGSQLRPRPTPPRASSSEGHTEARSVDSAVKRLRDVDSDEGYYSRDHKFRNTDSNYDGSETQPQGTPQPQWTPSQHGTPSQRCGRGAHTPQQLLDLNFQHTPQSPWTNNYQNTYQHHWTPPQQLMPEPQWTPNRQRTPQSRWM